MCLCLSHILLSLPLLTHTHIHIRHDTTFDVIHHLSLPGAHTERERERDLFKNQHHREREDLFKNQHHRERTYSKTSTTERGLIQKPAPQREDLFKNQHHRERERDSSSSVLSTERERERGTEEGRKSAAVSAQTYSSNKKEKRRRGKGKKGYKQTTKTKG